MLKSAPTKEKKNKDPEGRMPLAEHLRELRNRLAKAVLAIVVASVIAAFFYQDIINVITKPVLQTVGCDLSFAELAKKQGGETCARIVMMDLLGPFTFALKVSLMAGMILSSPVWLYQLWAFLAPGLHRSEKKYALTFVGAGFPLFLAGGYFAYHVLPTTAKVLIEFTPPGVDNLVTLEKLLDLVTRMIVVFGLSFELPLLLVLLNLGGVLTGKRMLGWWRGMIMGITVFAAVATPSVDPVSMILLAAPIAVLYFAAVGISLANDRRRARLAGTGPDDDEASELDLTPDDIGSIEPVEAPRALPTQSANGHELERRRDDMDDIT
ncbi:twin-arginine translocase subunit TatC [Streptomyces niger]|uniref:twin-arginine translocase subunit TatC n=1 Tax=Streptomyces niger TaxID=66373 RepID=UPI00069C6BF4|nr:twin-arginine translocase subunit TatC [Streptomyces niger]